MYLLRQAKGTNSPFFYQCGATTSAPIYGRAIPVFVIRKKSERNQTILLSTIRALEACCYVTH